MSGGSVSITANGRTRVSFFDGMIGASQDCHLLAVVVWRAPVVAREWVWSSLLRGQWPFGRRSSSRLSESPLPEPWDATVDRGGPHEILFSSRRSVVQLRDRDFPLPADGRTLVLLVQDPADEAGEATIQSHVMDFEPQPTAKPDRSLSKKAKLKRVTEHTRAAHEAWHDSIERVPVISAFLLDRSTPGAT